MAETPNSITTESTVSTPGAKSDNISSRKFQNFEDDNTSATYFRKTNSSAFNDVKFDSVDETSQQDKSVGAGFIKGVTDSLDKIAAGGFQQKDIDKLNKVDSLDANFQEPAAQPDEQGFDPWNQKQP